jgi:hypothetical protein
MDIIRNEYNMEEDSKNTETLNQDINFAVDLRQKIKGINNNQPKVSGISQTIIQECKSVVSRSS